MIQLSWGLDCSMNLQEPLMMVFYTNTTLLHIMPSEPLVMTVSSPMLLYFTNKIPVLMKTSWLVLPMLGKNGTNTLSGDMRVKMRTRSCMMLLMVSAIKLLNGMATGCSLENGVLLPILKPLSQTETSSFNSPTEWSLHWTKLILDGLTGPGNWVVMKVDSMLGHWEPCWEKEHSLSLQLTIIKNSFSENEENCWHCLPFERDFYSHVNK